jgi:hypothetical protein
VPVYIGVLIFELVAYPRTCQHRFTSGVKRPDAVSARCPDPGRTEASLAIARDADEMVFFTPS